MERPAPTPPPAGTASPPPGGPPPPPPAPSPAPAPAAAGEPRQGPTTAGETSVATARGTRLTALLTTRGRAFVAAGLASVVCAWLFGQDDLVRIGVLLTVLPLLCALSVYATRHRITAARSLWPARISAGQEARMHLAVENVSWSPSGTLMLQDQVPPSLGAAPRFALDQVRPRQRRDVVYRLRPTLRGRYAVGPLQVRMTDPFGMSEMVRSFSHQNLLTVLPRVQPLPPVRLDGDGSGYGEGREHAMAAVGEDDVVPREYRHGDDLRRVHWRLTARYGELMVRREEQPRHRQCTVLLDTRALAHRGTGPDSSFEWLVSAAASTVAHLTAGGWTVRLLTDAGPLLPEGHGAPGTAGPLAPGELADPLLDALAVITPSDGTGFARVEEVLRSGSGGANGVLIALLGTLDEQRAEQVAALRRHCAGSVAFTLDDETWHEAGPAPAPAMTELLGDEVSVPMLADRGWTVVPVRRGADFASLWGGADRHAAGHPARAAAGPAAGTAAGGVR
ncbi:DUF58 domain-containing protein [Allostreptomyces psammosilenae]|uniref:DUF58 domain-containing protein n=1 Tax=Allostreptomyces psammosilenae TaxID=1892865 RepID=A0A853A0W0_9ACTN|nr:DUF58 domain-containing protein [Allostreptomyces psammosilenae]NYI07090.1 hypothetical protein [Allostreptomyces psammosilenae]